MSDLRMRTWAEISLGAIEQNVKRLSAGLPAGCSFMGIVKADAYGHGAVEVSRKLSALGCGYFAVACFSEAQALRAAGIKEPLLILGYTPPEMALSLSELGITQTVTDMACAREMSRRLSEAGAQLCIHIKTDSGMARLGFDLEDTSSFEKTLEIIRLPGLDVEGIYTHFAVSDNPEDLYTESQYIKFISFIENFEKKSGFRFKIKHCANSGAVVNYKEMALDMVRPGIALYGAYSVDGTELGLRQVMSLKCRVAHIADKETGSSIGYGRTYTLPERRTIAVLPIGYADGLHRTLSNNMEVLISGRRARQVGRICMDMCMVDVTDIPDCAPGTVATVFGREGDDFISVVELASKAGTISYELLCAVSPRVPRIYTP